MIGLKENVVENIVNYLCSGECEKFKRYITGIGRSYKSINKYFTSMREFYTTIEIPTSCIRKSYDCINGQIRVLLDGEVVIDPLFGDGYEVTNGNYDEDFLDVMSMTIISSSVERVFSILNKLVEQDTISWCPDEINIDENSHVINEILSGKRDSCYRVRLGDPTLPTTSKITITTVRVVYFSIYKDNHVSILFRSDLLRTDKEYKPDTFNEIKQRIIETLDNTNNTPITTYLTLKLAT